MLAVRALIGHRPVSLGKGVADMFKVETEREADGRWIAEVTALPGVMCYGASREAAVAKAEALALRVLADRVEHGEARA
jgi:predicted RNase H-like HicB family nuclease